MLGSEDENIFLAFPPKLKKCPSPPPPPPLLPPKKQNQKTPDQNLSEIRTT